MEGLKIAAGSDHAGLILKRALIAHLESLGAQVLDLGTHSEESCDYPNYAKLVCEKVQSGEVQKGLLCCGSGIGISIAANKFRGIRCALCHDYYTATMSREHNDANIIAIGERVTGVDVAKQMVEKFMNTPFMVDHPNNSRRVGQINSFSS